MAKEDVKTLEIEDSNYGNCVYGVRYVVGMDYRRDYDTNVFFGKMLNFCPGGKCAFQNEITKEMLIIPYASIECIFPLKDYPKKYLETSAK